MLNIQEIVLELTDKPATSEFIERTRKSFALWWMSTCKKIIIGGN